MTFQIGTEVRLRFQVLDHKGDGVTGLTPKVSIRRDSDERYFDGSSFVVVFAELLMAAEDAANMPGVYFFEFDQSVDGTDHVYNVRYDTDSSSIPGSDIEQLVFGSIDVDEAAISVAVWSATTRTLTGFGSLVEDIATAVWSFGTRTLTSLGGLLDSVRTSILSALSPAMTRDGFLSFPDRSGGADELGFLLSGEIDLRDEMAKFLNRRGHKVFLRRASDHRCPSWREDLRETHPESCPYCWNGWMYQDELVLTYRRPALGIVAEGLVDTIRAPFGQVTARQTIFYFTHDVAPSVRDAIIFVSLDDSQQPLEPFNIERIWQIQMTEDFRDQLGRIEYWAVMAEQRSIGK